MVDDNVVQRCIIKSMLGGSDIEVTTANSGRDFWNRYLSGSFDVLAIDLMLPDVDGFELIQEIRSGHDSIPIIVISGKSQLPDKVRCLGAGADDYITKPFSHVELQARIHAVTRRCYRLRGAAVTIGNLTIDERLKIATCGTRMVMLSPKEFKLLVLLARSAGCEVPRETIGNLSRADGQVHSVNAVDKLVSRLRATLSAYDTGVAIRTVRRGGYLLEPLERVPSRQRGEPATGAAHQP
ncbi:MAG: response regulator transcription factor [Hyphomicrobiaceae bacterium]